MFFFACAPSSFVNHWQAIRVAVREKIFDVFNSAQGGLKQNLAINVVIDVRHQTIVLNIFNRFDIVQAFDIMSEEFLVTLEEEPDLVIDLGDVNLLWPCAKSEIFFCQFFVINDGSWWEIDVCADQTFKFMVAVLFSSFKFTVLTTCGFAQIAWNHCLVDSTSVAFA